MEQGGVGQCGVELTVAHMWSWADQEDVHVKLSWPTQLTETIRRCCTKSELEKEQTEAKEENRVCEYTEALKEDGLASVTTHTVFTSIFLVEF